MLTQTKHVRLKRLNLTKSDLLDKRTAAAFELTFADPIERFKLFKQLISLRSLLDQAGVKSKEDLMMLLGTAGPQEAM